MLETPIPSCAPAPLTGRRILVVEDEYFLADDIGRALRALGAEVIGPVGNVGDALHILERGGVLHGAVLDVNVRDQRIFPIARGLTSRRVPFVFTTGYDKGTIGPEFEHISLWEKPIDIAAMLRGLSGLIQNQT
ncbi:response regulator [Bradyrhizobium sp. LB11.1]|jgi:CheY-like chemotaxis protein|uniref:response regulator n=1 Tax=Bradyrhizobium sp. LB11.1 TaxID=3156326 RepID=UPI00339864C7